MLERLRIITVTMLDAQATLELRRIQEDFAALIHFHTAPETYVGRVISSLAGLGGISALCRR